MTNPKKHPPRNLKPPLNELQGMLLIKKIAVDAITNNIKVLVEDNGKYRIGIVTELLEDEVKVKVNKLGHIFILKLDYYSFYEFVISDISNLTKYPIARSQWNYILENKKVNDICSYYINNYTYSNHSVVRAKLTLDSEPIIQFYIEKKQIINIIYVLEKSRTEESLELANQLRKQYKIYGKETAIKKRINGKTYSNSIKQKDL